MKHMFEYIYTSVFIHDILNRIKNGQGKRRSIVHEDTVTLKDSNRVLSMGNISD